MLSFLRTLTPCKQIESNSSAPTSGEGWHVAEFRTIAELSLLPSSATRARLRRNRLNGFHGEALRDVQCRACGLVECRRS